MSRGVVQEVGRRFLVGSEAEVSHLFDECVSKNWTAMITMT